MSVLFEITKENLETFKKIDSLKKFSMSLHEVFADFVGFLSLKVNNDKT